MNPAKRPTLDIALRRFENELVELSFSGPAAAACRIAARADGDAQVYWVHLPAGVAVLPGDCRRVAYDHEKVAELLAQCARDNLAPLGFEPWSEELKERIEATLPVALGDLRSVFETHSVRCERSGEGRLLITVEGEHKNGESAAYVASFDLTPD